MSYTILLVDDEQDFRSEFKDCFEEYRIIEAGTAQQAMSLLEQPNEIALAILDVMLPDLRGTQLLRKIKQINPDLKVIILTGYSSKEIAISALKGHADDYLEKPVDIPKAKELIAYLLEKQRIGIDIDAGDLDSKIEKVKHFLEINCLKKVSLKDAADRVCMSPKYLSRIFKQKTGMNFTEYKLQAKVEKAKELLLDTGYNIDQISYDLGYENPESFFRFFKKFTGLAPTEFRKQHTTDTQAVT